MQVYVAGPMFTDADRAYLDRVATLLEAAGFEPFVPHRQVVEPLDPATVFRVDGDGLRACHAVLAWLDGPVVDDGTACEIGLFSELVRREPALHLGVVGLATDWRTGRRRDAGAVAAGLNLFVTGAIESCGTVCWDLDEAVALLTRWKDRLDG